MGRIASYAHASVEHECKSCGWRDVAEEASSVSGFVVGALGGSMALTLGCGTHSALPIACVTHTSAAVGGPLTPPGWLELPIQYPLGSPTVCPMTQTRLPPPPESVKG